MKRRHDRLHAAINSRTALVCPIEWCHEDFADDYNAYLAHLSGHGIDTSATTATGAATVKHTTFIDDAVVKEEKHQMSDLALQHLGTNSNGNCTIHEWMHLARQSSGDKTVKVSDIFPTSNLSSDFATSSLSESTIVDLYTRDAASVKKVTNFMIYLQCKGISFIPANDKAGRL